MTEIDRALLNQVAQDVSGMKATLSAVATTTKENTEKLERRAYGNGQPGDIPKLEKRVGKLERFRYVLMGATVGGSFGGAAFAHKVMDFLGGKH